MVVILLFLSYIFCNYFRCNRLASGAMVPLVAIGGPEDGVAPSPDVILEGLKIGELCASVLWGPRGVKGVGARVGGGS